AGAERPDDLAEHRHRRQQFLLSCRQAEFVGDEKLRPGDDGEVIAVDDPDAGRGEPDPEPPPRRPGQVTGTREPSNSTTRSGSSGVMQGFTRAPTSRISSVFLLPR